MKWSLFIGKISGIKIYIHWTFLFLIFWIILSGARKGYNAEEIVVNLTFVIAVFGCITLHELGHALTAKKFKFKTKDITLLPIGGLARMEGLPEKPRQEFFVAIMGPAVNIVIATILFVSLKLSNAFPEAIEQINITRDNFWFQLYSVNILLAVFNLVPAFPMDGGRILRALLSTRLTRAKATRIAALVGQVIAIGFFVFGIVYNPFLAFIGLFVFIGAQAEAEMEEVKALLTEIRVGDLVMHNFSIMRPDEPLSNAVTKMLDGQEQSFLVETNGHVEGVLSKTEIIDGLAKYGNEIPVEKVMQRNIVSLKIQDTITDVLNKFSDGTHTLMPVLDGSVVVGVLDIDNINEYVLVQNALREPKKFSNDETNDL